MNENNSEQEEIPYNPKPKPFGASDYHSMSDYDEDEDNFQECDECDGHDACRDYGCAIKLGLGHLVRPPL